MGKNIVSLINNINAIVLLPYMEKQITILNYIARVK